jgi:hypothetical protein
MIRRTFTHSFDVDLIVTRENDEFLVTAVSVDSDGGLFHTPSADVPFEVERVAVKDVMDDPIVGDDVYDQDETEVSEKTEAAVIMYIYGEIR